MFSFRVVYLFLLVGSVLSWSAPNYDIANAEQHFAEFIEKYNRRYESYEEYNKRLEIFTRTLKKINEWNELYKSEKGGYAVGPFSDLEEMPSCAGPNLPNNTNAIKVKKEFIVNAPDTLDYRNQNLVTGVKDSITCGSSFIFAAIGNIEGMHAKQGNLITLSEQQALDCLGYDGHSGGDPLDVMNKLAKEGGCESEANYPSTSWYSPGPCRFDPSKVQVKVTGGTRINTPDVESFKGALVQNGAPLATLLYASPEFAHAAGHQIVNPTDCNGHKADLAVLVVGYGKDSSSGKGYWIIKNSWGTSVGDNGYFYLDFNNQCSFGQATATASVA